MHYRIANQGDPEDFAKPATLEDQQAKWLDKVLGAWLPNATIDDLAWLEPLRTQLLERKEIKTARRKA
jgi:hypothetical protein